MRGPSWKPGRCSARTGCGRRPRPDPPARRRAAGPAHHRHGRVLDSDGRPVPRHAGRDLAGQRGRPLPARGRPAGRRRWTRTSPARAGALTDDDGPLRVRHRSSPAPTRGEPPQRLAPGAHPLLAVRPGVHPAPGHPDVLPGRPAVRPGPDLQLGAATPAARERLVAPLRPRPRPSRSGRWPTSSTSCCAARRRRRSRSADDDEAAADAVADGRAVPRHRPAVGRTARTSCPTARRARSGCAARCSTARASRCPTRWSRPGRPTPPAASTTRASAASPARPPTPAADVDRAHRQARPRPGAGRRPQAPHIDVSVFARGLLDRVVTRIYFADEAEANAADPVLPSVPAAPARHAARGHRPTTATASTSTCRARARPSSSMSDRSSSPAVLASPAVDDATSDTAWLQAMLDVEAALARAARRVGLLPAARRGDRRGVPRRALRRRAVARGWRARRDAGRAAGRGAAGRGPRPTCDRTSTRRDQPGHPRHRPDAGRPAGARRCSATCARPPTPAAGLARTHRGHAAGRPHAAAAGAATTFGAACAGRLVASTRRCAGWRAVAGTGWPCSSAAPSARCSRRAIAGPSWRGARSRAAAGRPMCRGTPAAGGSPSWRARSAGCRRARQDRARRRAAVARTRSPRCARARPAASSAMAAQAQPGGRGPGAGLRAPGARPRRHLLAGMVQERSGRPAAGRPSGAR